MNYKIYTKNINLAVDFLIRHFVFFRLLIIVIYLFILEILVLNVISAVGYIPRSDEVKFSPIVIKHDIIGSIEKYFLDKEDNLDKNLQREIKNDPFDSYIINDNSSADITIE